MSSSNPECGCQIYEICAVCTPTMFYKKEPEPTKPQVTNTARIQEIILEISRHPFLGVAIARTLGTDESILMFALLNRVQRSLCPFAQEGYTDALEGAERSDCPYEEGTDGQAGWMQGFDAVKRLAEEKPTPHTPT